MWVGLWLDGRPLRVPNNQVGRLRQQLREKDDALRYVEGELLGMRSMFDGKEAAIRSQMEAEVTRQASALAHGLTVDGGDGGKCGGSGGAKGGPLCHAQRFPGEGSDCGRNPDPARVNTPATSRPVAPKALHHTACQAPGSGRSLFSAI